MKLAKVKKRYVKVLAWALAGALLLVAVLVPIQTAWASLQCKPTFSYQWFTLKSCKDNYLFSGSIWKARMVSKVVSGGNIEAIGWWSWTDTQFCDGWAVFFVNYGSSTNVELGYGPTTNWASTSANHSIEPCGGLNRSRVYGKHYWEEGGYPYVLQAWSKYLTLP